MTTILSHNKNNGGAIIAVLLVFCALAGGVNAIQEPAAWWNTTTNMAINGSYNLTNEMNTTNSSLTMNSGTNLTIANSQINFSVGTVTWTNIGTGNFTIYNSTVKGTAGSGTTNTLTLNRNGIFYFTNSVISGFYRLTLNTPTKAIIANNNISLRDRNIFIFAGGSHIIDGNIIRDGGPGLFINSGSVNNNVTNNIIYNTTGGLTINSGINNTRIINNTVHDIVGDHGISCFSNNMGVLIENNTVYNIDSTHYLIDTYNNCSNSLIKGNVVWNASDGIISSSLRNDNVTFQNNQVYNVTGYAYQFNNASNSNSYADYAHNATTRMFTVTNSLNIGVHNFSSNNSKGIDMYVANSENVNVSGLRIYNSNTSNVYLSDSNATFFSNSLDRSNTIYNISIAGASNNVRFENVSGYYFNSTSLSTLYANLTSQWARFESYSSSNNNLNIYNLTNALIYFQNGSAQCTSIQSCDDNLNISVASYNYSILLDNFSVNQSATVRSNDPITVTNSSSNVRAITSTLTSTLTNVSVTVATGGIVPSSPLLVHPDGSSEYPSYLYDNVAGTITFNATIQSGVNTLYINEAQTVQDDICSDGLQSLDELGGWLPIFALLVGASVAIGALALFNGGFSIDGSFSLENIGPVAVTFVVAAITIGIGANILSGAIC